jgi:hypothetical protein
MLRLPVIAAMAAIVIGFMPLTGAPNASAAENTVNIPAGAKVEIRGNTAIINNGSNGVGGTYSCSCAGTGNCITLQKEGALWCGAEKDTPNKCTGHCVFTSTTGGAAAAAPITSPKSKGQ